MEPDFTPSTAGSFCYAMNLLASEQKQVASESASTVFISYSRTSWNPAAIDAFRRSLTDRLRGWVEGDKEPSQKHFWNFYDNVREYVSTSRQDADRNVLVAHEIGHYLLNGGRKRSSQRGQIAVIDDQHRFVAFEKATRDLSGHAIRSALQVALDDLNSFEDAETIWDLLEVLDNSLVQGVAKHVRWVDQCYSFVLGSFAPSTREWVLGFFFRTGNPPPRTGQSCPAEGWVVVIIVTEAWREGYATVQGQEDSRSLQNTIRNRYTKARFNRSARSHARVSGVPQFAGRRRSWRHYSLAQCA